MQADTGTTSDLDVLVGRNREYIRSVQTSDTKWFRDTLADAFRCSLPDGTLVDRERFLERAARRLDITNLQVHDVDVRLLGNVAIVVVRRRPRWHPLGVPDWRVPDWYSRNCKNGPSVLDVCASSLRLVTWRVRSRLIVRLSTDRG